MTRSGIEPRPPAPRADALTTMLCGAVSLNGIAIKQPLYGLVSGTLAATAISDGNWPNILKSIIRDFWSTIINVITICLGQGLVSQSHTESRKLCYYEHYCQVTAAHVSNEWHFVKCVCNRQHAPHTLTFSPRRPAIAGALCSPRSPAVHHGCPLQRVLQPPCATVMNRIAQNQAELPVDYKWWKIVQFGDRLEGILSFRKTNQKRIGSDRRYKYKDGGWDKRCWEWWAWGWKIGWGTKSIRKPFKWQH